MNNPSEYDIIAAKEYLKKRLSAENSMEHFLDSILLKAAREIVSLCYRANIPPTLFSFSYDPIISLQVNRIIAQLEDDIYEMNMELALKTDKDDRESLMPYFDREINGITYSDRLHAYTSNFKKELQEFILVGLVVGMGEQKLKDHIRDSYKIPYKKGVISDKPHKGYSSYERMQLLTRHTIADVWMYAQAEWMRKNGAVGYMVYRGSSYPCAACDDNTGYHPITEYTLPVHPRCCCYAVPIYNIE